MSRVLVRLHWNGHTTASASHGIHCGDRERVVGRIHLEERPRAAVAFKGDVPVLREPMHVVAAYTATDCAATKWICPPLPNLPSFFISHPYQDRWHARSSWRSWRALREMCWLGHDHLANLTGRPHASRKELHTDLTPSPPRSPGRPTPFPTFCEKPIHLVGLRRSLVRQICSATPGGPWPQ